MNLAISFVETRARRTDPQTSHDAAQNAATGKAANQRITIRRALERVYPYGLTTKELAQETGIDYDDIKRRVSESGGIYSRTERREGNGVWFASSF